MMEAMSGGNSYYLQDLKEARSIYGFIATIRF